MRVRVPQKIKNVKKTAYKRKIWTSERRTLMNGSTYISATRTTFFVVVSIAQLVEVMDSAVLGGVVEVVSSIPTVGHKMFSAFSGITDLLYLSISSCIINLYQFLILWSSKVLLLWNYISLAPNIYIISLVFSESDRLSLANGIDARHKKELKYDVYCISQYLYQCYSNNLFCGCLDSAVGRGDW